MLQCPVCSFDILAEMFCIWIISASDLALCVHESIQLHAVVQLNQVHDLLQLLHDNTAISRACSPSQATVRLKLVPQDIPLRTQTGLNTLLLYNYMTIPFRHAVRSRLACGF